MARERIHRNNAAKQAAYRARCAAHWQPVRQARMATLGQELHGLFRNAVRDGTNYAPAVLLGKQADETLINLMGYLTRGALPQGPTKSGSEGERPGAAAGEDPVTAT
jgi:hypothetical protein